MRQDYAKAAKWFRLAADQGSGLGQLQLGGLYYTGEGVPKDIGAAVKWFRLSAENGILAGQDLLGAMYDIGDGVPQDYV